MYQHKKIAVIIAAAGFGRRMNSTMPKQFLEIEGVPILALSIIPFENNQQVDEIIIVTGKEFKQIVKSDIVEKYDLKKVTQITEGGEERQDSVWKGIKELDSDVDIVLIHDGARPYVSQDVILRVIKKTIDKGAAVAAVPSKDTIKFMEDDIFTETPDREKVYNIQTPQGFEKALILNAYEKAIEEGFYGTDDARLLERLGSKVYFSMGDYKNIKITTPEDLPLLENSKDSNCTPRIGIGYDVHKLSKGRKLFLGGLEIPFEKGLLGHSDADVLLHALMDAMLGAAALGDIGKHFPDTEECYKDISSLKMLEEINCRIKLKGYIVSNADMTVIAERPKISMYIEEMKKTVDKILNIGLDNINIKGTTTEKLGFCGREEGIAAEAVVILKKL